MANTFDTGDYFFDPRDRKYPDADDPEAAFYGEREPLHWVDADGAPNPSEGTASPFTFYYSAPMRRQRRHHSIVPWLLIAALVILLALPILKVVLTVLAVISFLVVTVLGLGILALVVGAFILAHRVRTLSRRMYM